jgi:hypothetical protein
MELVHQVRLIARIFRDARSTKHRTINLVSASDKQTGFTIIIIIKKKAILSVLTLTLSLLMSHICGAPWGVNWPVRRADLTTVMC